MKYTSNSALARDYAGVTKEMLDEGFQVIKDGGLRTYRDETQADRRLGIKCKPMDPEDWNVPAAYID